MRYIGCLHRFPCAPCRRSFSSGSGSTGRADGGSPRRASPRFAEATGGIQLDSINVVERAHHLTLWSRFGPYDRGALDRLVYGAACSSSTGRTPPVWSRDRTCPPGGARCSTTRPRTAAGPDWLQTNRRVLRAGRGGDPRARPARAARFREPRARRRGLVELEAGDARARLPLDERARSRCTRGGHFQKRYDLAERVLPDSATPRAAGRGRLPTLAPRASLRAMGAATETDLRLYLTFPRFEAAERARPAARCDAARWSRSR